MHCMKMHKEKLSKVKASIDNRPPKKMAHLKRNLKREQMREGTWRSCAVAILRTMPGAGMRVRLSHFVPRLTVTHRAAERYSAIERENRILLQKMAQILRTNKTMDTINQYKARSLNREARRRELIRITHENQGILRRIQASEATYNHVEWEEDRRKMERRIDNISHYDRLGREKVLLQIKSQQRLNRTRNGPTRRFRPQSAPTYKAGSGRPRRTFCGMLPCAWVCSGWLHRHRGLTHRSTLVVIYRTCAPRICHAQPRVHWPP